MVKRMRSLPALTSKRIALASVAVMLATTAFGLGVDRLRWIPLNELGRRGSGCRVGAAAAPAVGPSVAQAPAAAPVPVAKPKTMNVSDTIELTGTTEAVASGPAGGTRPPGYLDQIPFEDGAPVKKGDLLFTIQQNTYQAQLEQAQSQLAA